MCRSIKKLRNPEPPTAEEVRAAALQFVRKISGTRKPPRVHEADFEAAVETITRSAQELLGKMGPPRVVAHSH